jgi:AraC-like DNA-binding protein
MAVSFTTSDVHPRDAVDYWEDVVTRGIVSYLTVESDGSAFQAGVRSSRLGSVDVSVYECDPHEAGRRPRDALRAFGDDYFICLQQYGRSTYSQDDRHAALAGGSFFLLDPRRPFAGRFESRGCMVAIRVSRDALDARTGSAAALAFRALDARGSMAGLVSGFLTMLPDCVDALDGTAASKVAEQALDLAALAFTSEARGRGVSLSSPRTVAVTLLKSAIETRLHDPGLRPAGAAAAAGISVRYANALLAHEGGIESYIFARRLERCRRVLADPTQAHRQIGEIAYSWGFSDLSHFGRRFKAEFGCSPSDYRRLAK